jgi:hypothetical protein
MDPYELIAQGGDALIAGWLSLTLVNGLQLPEDESEEHQQLFLQGAKAALEQLAPAGAWIGERIQAVQFLCAHSAAMEWLGQANSPHEPEPVRDKARKIANQMFALTSRQLATLARQAEERRAWRDRVQETKEQIARGGALTAELERMMKLGGAAEETSEAAAVPKAAGAAVPEPPPGPEADMNRQQRRALERLRRKEARR